MIVDTSAVIALIQKEPGHERLLNVLIQNRGHVRMASPNFLEATIVVDSKRDPVLSQRFDEVIAQFDIQIVPFTVEHARVAREAYRDFGRGSGHPAKLNFGDSIAYALARSEREPLLFVGDDFPHTDIEAA